MSKLKKLLEGVNVEWLALSDITSFTNGKGHEKVISDNGKFIVVNSKFVSTEGKIAKYSNEQICPLYLDDILIVMSDLPNGRALAKTYLVEADNKYTLNQRIGRITIKNTNQIVPRYLNYLLNRTPQLLMYNNGIDQTNLKKAEIQGILIPIPCPDNPEKSLKIQQEIVRILDSLSEETNQLTAALQKELDLHQKQYNFYREELFKFEGKEVEWKSLGEIADFQNGKGHEKVIDPNGKYIVVNSRFVSTNGLVAKYSNIQITPLYKNDILIVMSDLPNGRALARTFIVNEDDRYTLNQRIGRITIKQNDNIDSKFLYYILNRSKQLLKYNNGIDQTNLQKKQILDVKIPLLNILEQKQIVKFLDELAEKTLAITTAIKKEIALRNKQYEFYRDRLLSFQSLETISSPSLRAEGEAIQNKDTTPMNSGGSEGEAIQKNTTTQ